MNGKGEYIDSHHIMLLLIHYLYKYKGFRGEVATGFSSTVKIKKLCELYNLPLHIVPIGFKHICGLMLERDILMGGEESGGIAVKGHIPERDGVWNGMVIWEFMSETGKTLDELVKEIYDLVGEFAFERIDLTIPEEQKQKIVENCKKGVYQKFGKYKIEHLEDLDGFKYIIDDDRWVMIRPSGTEPVLRTYAEGKNKEEALDILKETHKVILNN
jgi:phosphomannomutase